MDKETIRTLKKKVEYVLENFPETRNSDIALTIKIWKDFFDSMVHPDAIRGDYIYLDSLYILPNQDNIKRIRANFNQEKRFLPTKWEVAKERGMLEEEWKKALGYNVTPKNQNQFDFSGGMNGK